MSFDFQRSMLISRRYQENILKEYHDAWDALDDSEYIDNKSIIRLCEQEIIKLDKIELQHSLQQLCIKPNVWLRYFDEGIAEMYRSCVLLHLIHVFCTPGQEEKMRVVQVKLNEVMHTMTKEERYDIIEIYISQRLKVKSNLTEIDMLTGQIDSQHEFQLKLFYWDIFYSKNGNEGCKEFLKKNADFLVSNIEGRATNWGFMWHIKLPLIACNILLCLLNWNICKTQKTVILQKDMETPVPSSDALVADPSTNYSFTAYKVNSLLQKICSTLSEDEIISAFNDYIKQMYAMNSGITEDDFCTERKAIENEVEMKKRSQGTETLVLFMLLLITITSTGHHKSAKLKKYLTLKYEYHMASLYLLWCSGDIEVHPGPSLNKKTLAHDSTIERRWIQNLSPKMINRLPEHTQSKFKPIKKVKKDRENREHFKSLLKKCLEEKVHVPKMYLAEINAWETMEYHLLYKLFVYRCEIDIIIASIKDFLKYEGSTKVITNINVSLITELQTNEIVRVLENYTGLEDKSQTMVKTIRKIAGISNTCARGKDPAAKWDGIWDLPLKNWPSDIMLFDPNNRGKYKKRNPGRTLVSDKELVDTFLSLPQITFPQKYKDMVDAYKLMRKNENKQHKDIFCGIFKRTTSIEKTDFALKNLCKNGIFTEEVHNILQKWWNMEIVETNDDEILLRVNGETEKEGRPHILINISTKFVTLTVKHTSTNGSQLVYDFPFNDELVPLKTMATTVGQTTIQKPSSDFYQKVTAKKYLTVSPKPDECPAANQVNLIIIPPEALTVLNTYFPCEIYPNSQAILESNIKHQHKISSRETTLCSTIDFNQPTSSKKQISQLNHNIAISEQPGTILCTPNQSTTNSDDISSATKDSQNPDFHMQVSPTSDRGSSDSISSVNSESGNEERDQNNTSNGGQDQLTDSDYSVDSSSNCVSKTSLKKRKCIEEDRIDMKKRKIPSLKQDKKQSETTSHRKIDSSMDNSTTCNKDMELLLDYLDIDLDSFDIDDQTFEVEMNTLDNEDKNLQVCDKDRNLMNDETQISNKNTTVSAYDTNVSSDLEMFLQEMICGESKKMLQMTSYLSDV